MREVESSPLRCVVCQRVIVSGFYCSEHIPQSKEEVYDGHTTEKKGDTKKKKD